ncbi:hypothetical protein DM01DRAFT_301471 [Hesseltinella vesiculosa]|uniref:Major facilitator superfamily associated domain-containing protein n=1 Tax=Hesseltinella vesiculosa TaxID=101127 RepID=A0A1X2GRJ6_9FUNG|nr:hypothetical protein DM01DRAFT_301471 [Hesseltinella vesiculosa]
MELPWTNLLAIANALTGTPWIYFVFYLYLTVDLPCFQIGLLMAYLYFIRLIATNLIVFYLEKQKRYFRLFLTSWHVLSALSCVLIFTWTSHLLLSWYPALIMLTVYGLTYLSMGVLVETVILKSWGDYRIYFYGHHRAWLEWTLLCLTIVTGGSCFMLKQDPSTLLYMLFCTMVVVGGGIMCFIVIFKSQSMPSGPTSLGLTPSSPWLLKQCSGLQPSDFMLLPSNFAPYKPYSLFAEPLSHISEEDASMLQRVQSVPSNLMRESSCATTTTTMSMMSSSYLVNGPPPSVHGLPINVYPSILSHYGATQLPSSLPYSSSPQHMSYTPSVLTTADDFFPHQHARRFSNTTAFSYDLNAPSLNLPLDSASTSSPLHPYTQSSTSQPPAYASSHSHLVELGEDAWVPKVPGWEAVSAYELALFSFVAPDMPAIALLPFLLFKGEGAIESPGLWTLINPPPVDTMKLYLLQFNAWLLGVVAAFIQTFLFVYFYHVLHLPIVIVGLAGSCIIMSELLLLKTVPKWINGIHVTRMTNFIHAVLVLCCFSYIFLQPDSLLSMVAALVLPFFQSGVFNMAWLVASNRINTLVWSDHHRIFQRSVLSTLYSCVGPMVGATLAGYMISDDDPMASFVHIYQTAIGMLVFSFIVTWGWADGD